MSDKKQMPADGGGRAKGMPDGVSGSPDTVEKGVVHGRLSGGESSGGAYPNPHAGKAPSRGGMMDHGGQTEMAYHGGDNPNATADPKLSQEEERPSADGTGSPVRDPHSVEAGRQSVDVVEDSGIAAAEATGKVATDAPYEEEQESPGGG